jgi:hypothetical protein
LRLNPHHILSRLAIAWPITDAAELITVVRTIRTRTGLPLRKSRPYVLMIQEEERAIGAATNTLRTRVSKRFARRSFLKDFESPKPPTFDSMGSSGCESSEGRNATAVRH